MNGRSLTSLRARVRGPAQFGSRWFAFETDSFDCVCEPYKLNCIRSGSTVLHLSIASERCHKSLFTKRNTMVMHIAPVSATRHSIDILINKSFFLPLHHHAVWQFPSIH